MIDSEKIVSPEGLELGGTAKDQISGFEGVVCGITFWLNGCATIGLRSKKLKEGVPVEPQWFDDPQLKAIKRGPKIKTGSQKGGPIIVPRKSLKPE